jgi:hypothetical protein
MGYGVIARHLYNLALTAVGFLAAAGCGKPTPAAPATVRGTVNFQGQPLAGGLIVFTPDREKGTPGGPLSATIGPDGGYQLSREGSPVVPAGWYRVAIADPPATFADDSAAPRFPAALRRPDQAGLNREVHAARENVLNFDIEVSQ